MPDYKSIYFELFRATSLATEQLLQAQKNAEEALLNSKEETIFMVAKEMQKNSPPFKK